MLDDAGTDSGDITQRQILFFFQEVEHGYGIL